MTRRRFRLRAAYRSCPKALPPQIHHLLLYPHNLGTLHQRWQTTTLYVTHDRGDDDGRPRGGRVVLDAERLHFFEPETEASIW